MKKYNKILNLKQIYNIYIKEQINRQTFDLDTEYDTTIGDEDNDNDNQNITDDSFIDNNIKTDEEDIYKEKTNENLINKYIIKKILE